MKTNTAVKITIIGSGDAFGSGGRLYTCFHVEAPAVTFLIDCGASAINGLKQNHINPELIDVILITHFHGDHYGGLPFFLLDASTYENRKLLTIISPPGGKENIMSLLELLYPGTKVLEKLTINFIEYHPFEAIISDHLTLKAYPVIHIDQTLPHGLRISVADKIISYSGDTEWTENLIELCENADLFICECCFYNKAVKGHLNYRLLKEKITDLNFKKIILTHFDDDMLNNMDRVDLECASDGMTINL